MEEIKLNVNGMEFTVKKEDYDKALEDGELKLSNDDFVVKSKSDFETYTSNTKKEGYNEGKVAGVEMAVKDVRDEYGLEFEGKTVKNFAEAFKNKIEADSKVKPTEKIQELEADKKTLQTNFSNLQSEFDTFKQTVTREREQQKIDAMVYAEIPADNLSISRDDVALIFKNRFSAKKTDEGIEWQKDGKTLKDDNLNPKKLGAIMTDFVTPYLKSPDGGTGKKDEPGSKGGTYEAFVKEMKEHGVNEGSAKFQEEMNKRVREKTLSI